MTSRAGALVVAAIVSAVLGVSPATGYRSVAPTAHVAKAQLGQVVLHTHSGPVFTPPPKYWSVGRCERVLLDIYGYGSRVPGAGEGLSTGQPGRAEGFHPSQVICVGSGGSRACRWTTGHRARLFAEFTVFARSPGNGGVVRSFTLATRVRPGYSRAIHHWGNRYIGQPADFYMSRTKLLATHANAARFRSLVAPIVASLTQRANASSCAGT